MDDDEPSRELFCKLLTAAGYMVREASDGLDAIRHMEETRFDVVLTDVCMPQIDGLELLTEIHDRWLGSRVVVHSDIINVEVARHAMTEGHMLTSPSPSPAQLLKSIASASLAV